MEMKTVQYTVKTKQAKYGKTLLEGTYIKSGKEILAKIFPPHDQVDRFVVLKMNYSTEQPTTFYAQSMEEALEIIHKIYLDKGMMLVEKGKM